MAISAASLLAAPTDQADRAELIKGVKEINAGGTPGGVCAFGPGAFALVAGREGGNSMLLVAAAARWDQGRIVIFGHDGFLDPAASPGTATVLVNAARWTSAARGKPRVGVVNNARLADHLKSAGVETVALGGRNWSGQLDGLSAVFVNSQLLGAEDLPVLEKFIHQGGGLITAATGWGWLQIHGFADASALTTEFPANRLMEKAGLAYTAGTPDRPLPAAYPIGGNLDLLSSTNALEAVTAHTSGKARLEPAALIQCSATLADALRAVPADDPVLLPRIDALGGGEPVMIRPDQPLRAGDPVKRLLVTRDLVRLGASEPEKVKALPASAIFPGAVPQAAPRIPSRTVAVDASVPRLHSTGLYAAPGEVIRVELPAEAVGKGWAVRIGCHTDSLWHLDSWSRYPVVSSSRPLKSATTLAASPFGGLIYVEVPEKNSGVHQVTISGAVEAPHFVLGKTGLAEWKERIRQAPAPWAELETGKLILSVPSEKIRQLEDPQALMTLWDRILDAEADLSTIPRKRPYPERIVPDVQISMGYMHSGYPIMTWMDHSVEQSLSVELLGKGSWGHFHELGHNHQQRDWTFDGTVEVTCNLYSLYVMETVCGVTPGQGHEAMEPGQVAKRLRDHLAAGGDKFDRWKKDPFLALTMYDQLRAAFGWDTYKKVFAEYRALPGSERPKNDDQARDQWLVRFSRAAGKNLGPFFEAWGVPTSEAARKSVADLPGWMPADWPKQ